MFEARPPPLGLLPSPLIAGRGLPDLLGEQLALQFGLLVEQFEFGSAAVGLCKEERLVLCELLEEGELVGLCGDLVLEAKEGAAEGERVEVLRDEADGLVVGQRLQLANAGRQLLQLRPLHAVLLQ